MLLVDAVNKKRLLQILKMLIRGEVSREEVVSWCLGVSEGEPDQVKLSTADGYWYLQSLILLDLALDRRGSPFIQDLDLADYYQDLAGAQSLETYRGYQRRLPLSFHPETIWWPLRQFMSVPQTHFEMIGLRPTRGRFDPSPALVEHLHVVDADDNGFLFVREFDGIWSELMMLGTSRDPHAINATVQAFNLDR